MRSDPTITSIKFIVEKCQIMVPNSNAVSCTGPVLFLLEWTRTRPGALFILIDRDARANNKYMEHTVSSYHQDLRKLVLTESIVVSSSNHPPEWASRHCWGSPPPKARVKGFARIISTARSTVVINLRWTDPGRHLCFHMKQQRRNRRWPQVGPSWPWRIMTSDFRDDIKTGSKALDARGKSRPEGRWPSIMQNSIGCQRRNG